MRHLLRLYRFNLRIRPRWSSDGWACRVALKAWAPVVVLLSSILFSFDAAAEPTRTGGEFQINAYTTNSEFVPRVAYDPQGRFAVAWQGAGSPGDDTSGATVQIRIFAADATPGEQIQVNTYTTGPQTAPHIALGAGGFIVVWSSTGSSGSDNFLGSIQGRRFDSAGTPLTDDFQVNSYTTGTQGGTFGGPVVASDAAGNFIVVWSSANDSFSSDVKGQRFDSTGAFVGPEFQVNTSTTGDQDRPQVAMAANGDFVVAWQSGYYVLPFLGGYDKLVRARRFTSNGAPLGADFQVNTYTSFNQSQPSVAMFDDGGFVIVWQSGGAYGPPASIRGQRYSSTGSPLGSEFQVHADTTGHYGSVAIVADPGGGFTVAWQGPSPSGMDSDIMARHFASDGSPLGSAFLVNTYTTETQRGPALASRDGRSIIVWSGPEIQGQRFCDGFCDGFESGNTCTWSMTEPAGACPPP